MFVNLIQDCHECLFLNKNRIKRLSLSGKVFVAMSACMEEIAWMRRKETHAHNTNLKVRYEV
ncbi:MAG: hypothetical protein A3K50_12155 [Planctomycetes bacterium RIFOXYD12_FULL_42_12]|nr:MAG: hypothetical protein A3K50_12155 [Planctomycetes bacterium RIFOXYD12_FULL_42_12]